jgi:hypothetical protein
VHEGQNSFKEQACMTRPNIPADLVEALERFGNRAHEIVQARALDLEKREPPRTIYHYTTDAGLRGILESGRLWFTDIFDLNDPSELRHSYSIAVNLVHEWAQKVRDKNPEAAFFAKRFAELLDRSVLERAAHIYVCSFSARGDDLGQWRAYADNGRGYALGFDTRALETKFALPDSKRDPNNVTFPVSYDEKELASLQAQIVNSVFDLVLMPRAKGLDSDSASEFTRQVLVALSVHTVIAALSFKHWGYSNEEEYRFLQLFSSVKSAPDVKRRFRPHQLVNYREFDWRSPAPEALSSIVLGPAADRVKAPKFASDCIRAFGYKDINITQSAIPYRAL